MGKNMLAEFISQTRLTLLRQFSSGETMPLLLYFSVIFSLHLDVEILQRRAHKGHHARQLQM
jgi:hypothetical protein